MRAARQVREHGFPAEHAGARCQRLILQGNGHIARNTSLFRLMVGSASVKAAAPESKQTRNPGGYLPSGNRCQRVEGQGRPILGESTLQLKFWLALSQSGLQSASDLK